MRHSPGFNLAPWAIAICALSGCAHTVTPLRVRADSTPWPARAPDQPLIIDYKAGERIPVTIQVDGEIIQTTPNPSTIWLTAKRDFSVRVQGAEIKTSLDGTHFDDKPAVPGHFQLGIQAERNTGAGVVLTVVTPVHAKHE
jgi:hypothetical protein